MHETTSSKRKRPRQKDEDRTPEVAEQNGNNVAVGVLSKTNDGYGFLKTAGVTRSKSGDVYVSQSQIRRFGLRAGDEVSGQVRPPKDGERYLSLVRVESVNEIEPDKARQRAHFEDLIPIFPKEQIFVVDSNELENLPQQTLNKVFEFLNIPSHEIPNLSKVNVGKYAPMAESTRKSLIEFYKPHNAKLNNLLGTNFDWDK